MKYRFICPTCGNIGTYAEIEKARQASFLLEGNRCPYCRHSVQVYEIDENGKQIEVAV